MSLAGNLGDLALADILKIVGLSKRSGILTLKRDGEIGTIIIRDGKIVQAFSQARRETLGEILVREGLLSPSQLREVIAIQEREGMARRLGTILLEQRFIESAVLKEVIKKQVEAAIADFLGWEKGFFTFQLREVAPKSDLADDPELFLLERGIDPQKIGAVGAGKREKSAFEEAAFRGSAEEIEEPFSPVPGEVQPSPVIFIVDDDTLMTDLIGSRFRERGLAVGISGTCPQGLEAVKAEARRGTKMAVIVNLVMPTFDGKGFLGGVELIRRLEEIAPGIPIIALSPYPDAGVRGHLQELPVSGFVVKPAREGKDPEIINKRLDDFVNHLVAMVESQIRDKEPNPRGPFSTGSFPPQNARPQTAGKQSGNNGETFVDLRAQIMEELGEQWSMMEESMRETPAEETAGMAFLREMLRELAKPAATTEITLLILRFATELVNRAVLFLVKDNETKGLGGFGFEAEFLPSLREITIARDEPCLMNEVIAKGKTYKGSLPETAGDRFLMDCLGGDHPKEVLLMPVVSRGRAILLLYGDNLPRNNAIPAADFLEIFISQAGLVLEKAFLEEKIRKIEPRVQ